MSTELDIQKRLDALPQKTAMPFRHLVAAEQLTEEALHVILDAGELAKDTGRLLGFAIAYLHFRSQGVPVHDVVQMAKQQHRRVNLGWSGKRWREEHNRLSRAETLLRLAGDNVAYDLSEYAELLPAKFDGYLIGSSRRLGMEGLRQCHCVASYHHRIASGHCAIASIFADDKRWTVELRKTGDADAPLSISQIKTRYNGHASEAVRDQIHALLDIEKPMQSMYQRPEREHHYMDTLRRVLPVLRERGVERVNVYFNGSGDDGCIEEINFHPDSIADLRDVRIEHNSNQVFFEDGQWLSHRDAQESPIEEVIKDLTDDYLSETGVDWYNDDGGSGDLWINVEAGSVELSIDVRYTESTCEFDVKRDILTGEEI